MSDPVGLDISGRADHRCCLGVIEALCVALEEHLAVNAYFMAQIERYGLTQNVVTDKIMAQYRGFGARANAALAQVKRL